MTSSAQADGITMSGDGVYSLATKGAKDVIDHATPLILDAIDSIPPASYASGFVFSDMGCADGGTSLEMVGKTINRVRSDSERGPVSVIYTDQPRNDFGALVRNVHGLGPFDTYMDGTEGVYPMFSGTSFYRQILPSATLHLGFSATAMHWLSSKPGNISTHVHMIGARNEELRAYQEHAKRDWQTILLHRAAELVSGGKLVLVNFAVDENGNYLGHTGGVNMFDTFNEIWLEFMEQGKISREEYVEMTLPQYYNTVDEFSAPLSDPRDPVYQAGLRLEHIETRIVPCPFATDFKEHGDAERFAREYIPTIRTWNESTYFSALTTERTIEERKELIEEYYATYQHRVRNDPSGHGMDYVHAYMVIGKL